MRHVLLFLGAIALLCACPWGVEANPILIFDTGVNGSGTPLADGTIGDPHYSLTSVPGGSTTAIRVRTSAGGFPVPPWLGDNSTSAWIGPNNDTADDGPVGSYTYRTTFDLTGLNPATANLSGQWSTDNNGLNILINGIPTGFFTGFTSFSDGFSAFTISSGFVSGINTLDFVVNNGGGPTGLRVEVSGTAAAVPEPTSLALFGMIGFGAVAVYGWRRRKQAVPA
jgi:hypothetical protein